MRNHSQGRRRLLFNLAFILCSFTGLLSCDVSTPSKPDTLTFHLPDSLLFQAGKYDSVRLELYKINGSDTLFVRTLFSNPYESPDQLAKMPLPDGLDGNFLIRVSAFRDGIKAFDKGVPFQDGRPSHPISYPVQAVLPNRTPAFTAGLEPRGIREGETLSVVIRARDEDGDAVSFTIQNLDSLRALFPGRTGAISFAAAADSMVLRFDPGAAPGNYRIRIAIGDPSGAVDVQVLVLSVGKINRPPFLALASPASGTSFRISEGQAFSLRITAIDPDSGQVARLLPLDAPPWPACGTGAYDTVSGTFTFKPEFACAANGELMLSRLVFRALDNGDAPETGELGVTLTIADSNTAPRWAPGPIQLTGKEGRPLQLELDAYFQGDAEGDSVTFSATCGAIQPETLRWTFVPGFRDSGQTVCTLTASDTHQPPASAQLRLELTILDSARALEVDILSPARGAVFHDSTIRVSWQVEGNPQARDTTEKLLKEGPNLVRRSFRDSLGNEGSDTLTVILDTQAPGKPSVRSPGWTNQARPRWTWRSGGEGGGEYRVRLDTLDLGTGAIHVKDTAYTVPENLMEGRHVLYVQERDAAGNWSAIDSGIAKVDLTAPVVAFSSPANGHVTNQGSVSVAWTVDAKAQASFNQTLTEGSNSITKTVSDSAGNQGTATLTVTRRSQVVFVNAAAAADGDGTSWATACNTLQQGMAKAQSGWEVWVSAGSYSPLAGLTGTTDTVFALKVGTSLLGGFSGKESSKESRDWKKNETILTGETGDTTITDNLPRILSGANNAVLDGFAVQRGCSRSSIEAAMINERVSPKIRNCIFRDNSSTAPDFGAMVLINSESSPTFEDCAFIRNSSKYIGAIRNISASPSFINCMFNENFNSGTEGTIVNANAESQPVFSKCVFLKNTGWALTNSGAKPKISNCIFVKNTSQIGGGAIWGGSGTISNSVFIENSTQGSGGALHVFDSLLIVNCTFYRNTAGEHGGAIYHHSLEATSHLTIRNSIFSSDASIQGGNSVTADGIGSVEASFSELSGIAEMNGATLHLGPGMINVYPNFLDASNPMGSDGLYFTSDDGFGLNGGPCVNAGDTVSAGLPATDITGGARIKGGRVDIGAYEY